MKATIFFIYEHYFSAWKKFLTDQPFIQIGLGKGNKYLLRLASISRKVIWPGLGFELKTSGSAVRHPADCSMEPSHAWKKKHHVDSLKKKTNPVANDDE